MIKSLKAWLSPGASNKRRYPVLNGSVVYAIGDVHGRSDCLARVHARIDLDMARQPEGMRIGEVYLGDLVNRGNDSRGVVDALIERAQRRNILLVKGNHEIALERFLTGELGVEGWKRFGGFETLRSYGVSPLALKQAGPRLTQLACAAIPSGHRDFLASAEPFFRVDDYVFVHAGLRPGVALEAQSIEDLAWIRNDFLDYGEDYGFIVVHGHTPVAQIDFKNNRINMDTGAYATNHLSLLRLDRSGPIALFDEDI
ncbi:MAG: Serine/threonine protein phosphatase family protein [Hyphomicrobiales bacterium]|nr:Serine/threonine protein phosphatase family protein [Hyphomicrobiales bacterium]